MTEKEKCDAGLLHVPFASEEMLQGLQRSRVLCHEFNTCHPAEEKRREEILKELIGEAKGKFIINEPFHCDFGSNITLGNNFYANYNCVILDAAPVVFGDDVLIGPNCCFTTSGHPFDEEKRKAGLEFAHPITVGNNVWFGAGVIVIPGITIGDNVVIGAGSVVNRDIPSGVVAAGNPCRVIREITDADRERYR